jgi:hypothetical protein
MPVCVAVRVVRAGVVGWDGATVVGGRWIRLVYASAATPLDSVRLDVELPPR